MKDHRTGCKRCEDRKPFKGQSFKDALCKDRCANGAVLRCVVFGGLGVVVAIAIAILGVMTHLRTRARQTMEFPHTGPKGQCRAAIAPQKRIEDWCGAKLIGGHDGWLPENGDQNQHAKTKGGFGKTGQGPAPTDPNGCDRKGRQTKWQPSIAQQNEHGGGDHADGADTIGRQNPIATVCRDRHFAINHRQSAQEARRHCKGKEAEERIDIKGFTAPQGNQEQADRARHPGNGHIKACCGKQCASKAAKGQQQAKANPG